MSLFPSKEIKREENVHLTAFPHGLSGCVVASQYFHRNQYRTHSEKNSVEETSRSFSGTVKPGEGEPC